LDMVLSFRVGLLKCGGKRQATTVRSPTERADTRLVTSDLTGQASGNRDFMNLPIHEVTDTAAVGSPLRRLNDPFREEARCGLGCRSSRSDPECRQDRILRMELVVGFFDKVGDVGAVGRQ